MQLLTNANKYTPNGGTIALKIECDNGYIQASVCDTGPGIPLSEQEKIFNPYYRGAKADAQRASQSSGLGLSIAKYLVELHGGRIWVESEVNRGSTFAFILPVGEPNESPGD